MSRFIAFLFVLTLFVGCGPADKPSTPPADSTPAQTDEAAPETSEESAEPAEESAE